MKEKQEIRFPAAYEYVLNTHNTIKWEVRCDEKGKIDQLVSPPFDFKMASQTAPNILKELQKKDQEANEKAYRIVKSRTQGYRILVDLDKIEVPNTNSDYVSSKAVPREQVPASQETELSAQSLENIVTFLNKVHTFSYIGGGSPRYITWFIDRGRISCFGPSLNYESLSSDTGAQSVNSQLRRVFSQAAKEAGLAAISKEWNEALQSGDYAAYYGTWGGEQYYLEKNDPILKKINNLAIQYENKQEKEKVVPNKAPHVPSLFIDHPPKQIVQGSLENDEKKQKKDKEAVVPSKTASASSLFKEEPKHDKDEEHVETSTYVDSFSSLRIK